MILGKAIRGFFSDSLGSIFYSLLTLMTLPYIINIVGNSVYGDWIIILAVIGFVGLLDLGLGQALIREVAISDSTERINALASSTLNFLFILSIVLFSICGLLLNVGLGDKFFFIDNFSLIEVVAIFILLVPLNVFRLVLVGLEFLTFVNTASLVANVMSLALLLTLIHYRFGLTSFIISHITRELFLAIICAFKLFRFTDVRFSFKFSTTDLSQLFHFGLPYLTLTVANTINLNMDSILLKSFFGSTIVSRFTITGKFYQLFSVNIISKLPAAMFPVLSKEINAVGSELKELLTNYAKSLVHYLLIIGSVLAVVNQQLVDIWIGINTALSGYVAFAWLLWFLTESFVRGLSVFIYAGGDLKLMNRLTILEAITNVLMSLILLRYAGVAGVLIATVLARTIIVIPYLVKYLFSRGISLTFTNDFWISHIGLLALSIVLAFADLNRTETFLAAILLLLYSLIFHDFKGIRLDSGLLRSLTVRMSEILNFKHEF